MQPYPTRNGLAIPTCEVELPESHLNLQNPNNWNNHHREFSAKMFSHTMMLKTLRDLSGMQEMMPMDIHNFGKDTLHTRYSPPKLPTPRQAMDRIGEAWEEDEELHIWNNDLKLYELKPITLSLYKALKREYWKEK